MHIPITYTFSAIHPHCQPRHSVSAAIGEAGNMTGIRAISKRCEVEKKIIVVTLCAKVSRVFSRIQGPIHVLSASFNHQPTHKSNQSHLLHPQNPPPPELAVPVGLADSAKVGV